MGGTRWGEGGVQRVVSGPERKQLWGLSHNNVDIKQAQERHGLPTRGESGPLPRGSRTRGVGMSPLKVTVPRRLSGDVASLSSA